MGKDITTIKISKLVVEKLSKLKVHPRQSYEEVMVNLLNDCRKVELKEPDNGFIGKREITTIKISKNTVKGISRLKVHPRQSYEEVIVKLLGVYRKND